MAGRSFEELRRIAREIGCGVIATTTAAGSGHPGGSLSIKEVLSVLLFRVMRHDPRNPAWPMRDRLVLSKGHAAPALYAALALAGYIDREELYGLRRLGSRLGGHPDYDPGIAVEASTGALGNGFAMAAGMALAAKMEGSRYRVFAVLGDGELQEGIVWEAAMFAAHHRLDNLVAVVDRNGLQLDGAVENILSVEPLADKWRAFGWLVAEADGNDVESVSEAIEGLLRRAGRPKVLIAHTEKGASSSIMRWNPDYHGKVLRREQCEEYLRENGCEGWRCGP
ncbi:MAG: transketolase [Conexivisphaera sp.]